jgi:hypothetical protein
LRKYLIILLFGLSSGTAQAVDGLIITDSSGTLTTSGLSAISGFSGTQTGTFGTLTATVDGTVSYTYLGSSAGFTNSFGTSTDSYSSFLNQNAQYFSLTPTTVGTTYTTTASAGTLDFGFKTIYPTTYSGNAVDGTVYTQTDTTSFIILSGGTINGVTYDYFIAYNDPYGGSPDYNDMVVGVNFVAAVPEAHDVALFGTGLLCVVFASRRRRQLQGALA